ncbi:hypothetical protein LBMAG21_10470 [Armatimonadota bacterium]|nr:hypothetical protein LBMAG21_10470 [Armatimonadota bacterium]
MNIQASLAWDQISEEVVKRMGLSDFDQNGGYRIVAKDASLVCG